MKKVIIKISALSITAMVLATSCSKTGPTGPSGATGSTGPNLTGSIQGVVSLYDVSGSKIISTTELAGDTLVLTNSSTGAMWKTATNTIGSYTFANVTTGTYSMTVSKPTNAMGAYGSVITQGIQFVGGGNSDRNFALAVIPTNTVTSALAKDTTYASTGANYIKIRGSVPATAGGSTVIVFVSLPYLGFGSTTVGNYAATYTVAVAPGAIAYKILIPTADLYDYGFVSGNPVFFATTILGGTTSTSSYVDWATGQTVYTALATPAVVPTTTVQ